MKKFTILTGLLALAVFVVFAMPAYADHGDDGKCRGKQKTVCVHCAKGKTIAKALKQGDKRKPLIIIVKGICNENVPIQRDDVTLQGDTRIGGGVNGVTPNASTIVIDGAGRLVIDNLTVSGDGAGVLGVNGASFSIQNSIIENNKRSGVAVVLGSTGIIEGSTIQNSGGNGVFIEDSTATIIDNAIKLNGSSGIRVTGTGHARIGLTILGEGKGNTIEENGADGIAVFNSANAYIFGNTIQENYRYGIGVGNASSARLVGNNTIQGNDSHGVGVFRGGMLFQGKGDFPITPNHDMIQNNKASGIVGFNNASLDIQDATISNNDRHGIVLKFHSTLRIFNSDIHDNLRYGILLREGSALKLEEPPVEIYGNGISDIICLDTESSIIGDTSLFNVDNCTDFGAPPPP